MKYNDEEESEPLKQIPQTNKDKEKRQTLKLLFCIILMIMQFYLFQKIYTECPYVTETQCSSQYLIPRLTEITLLAIISNSINTFLILLESPIFLRLVHLFVILTQVLSQKNIMSSTNYSLLYSAGYVIILILLITMGLLIRQIFRILRKSSNKCRIFVMICTIYLIFRINKSISYSCKDWRSGLNNVNLDNDPKTCNIESPNICWYDIFEGVFDLTILRSCNFEKSKALNHLSQYIQIDNGQLLAFPYQQQFSKDIKFLDQTQYQMELLKQVKNVNDTSQFEVFLNLSDFKYMYCLFHIGSTQLKFNQTLSELKHQQFQENHQRLPKNIITIWIDAVSRARLIKNLKNSTQWFGKQRENYTTYQGMKFVAINNHTLPIYLSYEYGMYIEDGEQVDVDYQNRKTFRGSKFNLPSLSKQLSDKGYVVGKSRDQCNSQIGELDKRVFESIEPQYADHENIAMSCDPNFQDPVQPYGLLNGPYSIVKKCVYDQQLSDQVIEYSKQFLEAYKTNAKYLELYFVDAHEGTGEVLKYLEEPISQFLDWLELNDHIKDSVIILQSDHGLHMQGLFYVLGLDIFKIELALPSLFILMDDNLISEQQKLQYFFNLQFFFQNTRLKKNEQIFSMQLDVHHTIKTLTGEGESSKKSLFSDDFQQDRTCSDSPKPKDQYCPCQ